MSSIPIIAEPSVTRDVASMIALCHPAPFAQVLPLPTAGFPAESSVASDDVSIEKIQSVQNLLQKTKRKIFGSRDNSHADLLHNDDPILSAIAHQNSTKAMENHITATTHSPSKKKVGGKTRRCSHAEKMSSCDDIESYIADFLIKFEDIEPAQIPLYLKRRSFSRTDLCWKTLAQNINDAARSSKSLHEVPLSQLSTLLTLIGNKIDTSIQPLIISSNQPFDEESFNNFRGCVEAGIIALSILTSKDIARELISDEISDHLVQLIQHHTCRSIIPLASSDEIIPSDRNDIITRLCVFIASLDTFCRGQFVMESGLIAFVTAAQLVLSSNDGLGELQIALCPLLTTCFILLPPYRERILDEMASIICCKERTSKRMHTRGILVGEVDSIEICSAIVLLLVQASALSPCISQKQFLTTSESVAVFAKETYRYSRVFVACLIQRSLGKAQHSSSNVARKAITGFLQDIQVVAFNSQWPAGNLVLHDLIRALGHLVSSSSNTNVSSRVISIELMGSCLAYLRLQWKLACADHKQLLQRLSHNRPIPGDDEVGNCICGVSTRNNILMIDCDECHSWFHSDCIRVNANTIPERWICDRCQLGAKVAAKIHALSSSNEKEERFEVSLKTVVVDFLGSCRGSKRLGAIAARQTRLALWSAEICESQKTNADTPNTAAAKTPSTESDTVSPELAAVLQLFSNGHLDTHGDVWKDNDSELVESDCLRLCRVLGLNGPLLSNFRALILLLIRGLKEKLPSIRSRVLKALAVIIESDPLVLREHDVMNGVRAAVQDRSVSVREAALDLIGKEMLQFPALAEQYYNLVAERVRDRGLSVRKRVIRILRDICTQQPQHSRYSDACASLISQSQSEESMRTLIRRTARQMWFEDWLMSSKRTQNSYESDRFLPEFSKMVFKFIEVVEKLSNVEWMVSLIESMISEEECKLQKDLLNVCHDFVACIVSQLLSAETSASLRFLETLKVFCRVRPVLLIAHIETLQPYLKSASNSSSSVEQNIFALVSSILLMVLPVVENPRQSFVQNLEIDLRKLIFSQGSAVLVAAIPCLCALAKLTEQRASPLQLLKSFFAFLKKHANIKASLSSPVKKALFRSLISCGLLIKFFDFDSIEPSTTESVLRVITRYVSHSDEIIRRSAIQGMMFCFSRKPASIISYREVLNYALSDSMGPIVHAQILRSFADFLQSEDIVLQFLQRMEVFQKAGLSKLEATTRLPGYFAQVIALRSSSDADTGVITGIVQSLLARFLVLSQSSFVDVRRAFLQLTSFIVRQRLVNPVQCLSTLISLCADREYGLSERAFQGVFNIYESFPSMLRSRLNEGVRMAFEFHDETLDPNFFFEKVPTEFFSGLCRVYRLLDTKPTERVRLIKDLISTCTDKKSHLEDDDVTLERLQKMTRRVAFVALLFSVVTLHDEEVISLIDHLNRLIGILSSPVDKHLDEEFSLLRQAQTAIGIDQRAQISKSCEASSLISVLLVLKAYLRKKLDKAASSKSESSKLEINHCLSLKSLPRTSTGSDSVQDMYRQYAFFKALLERDAIAIEEYSPSRKRKRGDVDENSSTENSDSIVDDDYSESDDASSVTPTLYHRGKSRIQPQRRTSLRLRYATKNNNEDCDDESTSA